MKLHHIAALVCLPVVAACAHEQYDQVEINTTPLSPFTASGNEPGWRVDIWPLKTSVVLDYGERRFTAPTPQPEATAAGSVFRFDDEGVTLTISDALCADDATGMPHPKTVLLEEGGRSMNGCGGYPVSLIAGGEWVVEDIGGDGVVDGARSTLQFSEDGRVTGSSSCNRYGGGFELNGEGLSFGRLAATKRACMGPIMDQERNFFSALGATDRFEIDETGALVLYGADKALLLARR